jgi:hypothetical protein
VQLLGKVQTWQVPVPLSERRCGELSWWMTSHAERLKRLVALYQPLGYPAIQLLVRPGERSFMELADCLVGPEGGGFVLSIDYGASFEVLGHSQSLDPHNDGVFIPPVPHELLQDLPDCYGAWHTCAGRVDWTSFVDFTNVAVAGEQLGWGTQLYGPQSFLEHLSRRNLSVDSRSYSVPGYSVLAASPWASRHVRSWYGSESPEKDPRESQGQGWQQRWTSFKALLLHKPLALQPPSTAAAPGPPAVVFPSWHLDADQADVCWRFDPSALPLADWIRRQSGATGDPREALERLSDEVSAALGPKYASAYEEAQLAVRLVDWLVAAEGCAHFRPPLVARILRSEGLWASLRRRLLRAWEAVWGSEAVERVALAVLRRLAEEGEEEGGEGASSPAECLGRQTYAALCEAPGDAGPAQATGALLYGPP